METPEDKQTQLYKLLVEGTCSKEEFKTIKEREKKHLDGLKEAINSTIEKNGESPDDTILQLLTFTAEKSFWEGVVTLRTAQIKGATDAK